MHWLTVFFMVLMPVNSTTKLIISLHLILLINKSRHFIIRFLIRFKFKLRVFPIIIMTSFFLILKPFDGFWISILCFLPAYRSKITSFLQWIFTFMYFLVVGITDMPAAFLNGLAFFQRKLHYIPAFFEYHFGVFPEEATFFLE